MKKVWFLTFVVGLCAIFGVLLSQKGIRLGKDLQGGVSLVYSVKVPDTGDSNAVLGQVIEVLKQRVNPQGVLDIAMQPQGRDRIEVVMPLPSAEVRDLQVKAKTAIEELLAKTQISAGDLDAALLSGRAAARFGAVNPQVNALEAEWQSYQAAKKALEALPSEAPAKERGPLEDKLVASELRVEQLKADILSKTLPAPRLQRALQLSTLPAAVRDAAGNPVVGADGKSEMGPSPREKEIAAIKADFPALASELDSLVAANDAYLSKRTGLDDPEDLMRLMRGAGVLEFRIAVRNSNPTGFNIEELRQDLVTKGPGAGEPGRARWFKVNDLKQWYDTPEQLQALRADPVAYFGSRYDLVAGQFGGESYLLLNDGAAKSMTHDDSGAWGLTNAYKTVDPRLGGAAVAFRLDAAGGQRMARLTGANQGEPMAIVLDDEVFSAPTLNATISDNGIITGQFDDAAISYLIRVLTAGSLEAKVSSDPISVNILGPSIGADNLEKGLEATILSVVITCIVMLAYYFLAGLVADIALAVNTLFIFGLMALIDGTFTLPGLAGVALSVAMAVDANVLIYERMREELQKGNHLGTAISEAYRRALSAIIDGNITNLIVCIVLYKVGATEVKGFALTMSIGVITTLFTGIWVTRAIFDTMLAGGLRKLPMLPTVVPAISRVLLPKVDWIALRPTLLGFSGVLALISVVVVLARGNDIFETEFRGGVSMTLSTRPAAAGEPQAVDGHLGLTRQAVEDRVREIGKNAGDDKIVAQLANANVLTVGQETKDGLASSFQIRVGNPPSMDGADESRISRDVQEAVVVGFAKDLDVRLPLEFTNSESGDHTPVTRPLEKALVGSSIGRPNASSEPVGEFRGGVAIVIDGLKTPITAADAAERIRRMRSQPDWSSTAGRPTKVLGLEAADPANPTGPQKALVVLVNDAEINATKVDLETWDRNLASKEWDLVRQALTQQASLDQVSSFSPVVAENLAASAVVAVILSLIGMLAYIWVRFGSFRFSTATVVGVTFNVIVCLGFLAISIPVAQTGFGTALYIEQYRIDLNVVAGLLTIIGYSLNDTIVILDRVRENRGKRAWISRETVNLAINQTFSRTVLTGGSTLATAIILISLGGTGIRPFAYTFLIGLIAGTFSSVAIAAPLVYSRREEEIERAKAAITPTSKTSGPAAQPA